MRCAVALREASTHVTLLNADYGNERENKFTFETTEMRDKPVPLSIQNGTTGYFQGRLATLKLTCCMFETVCSRAAVRMRYTLKGDAAISNFQAIRHITAIL